MSSAQASLLGQALTRPDDGRGQALRLNTKNEAQVAEHQGEAGSLPLQPAELTFDLLDLSLGARPRDPLSERGEAALKRDFVLLMME